jgi:hypothetical protein
MPADTLDVSALRALVGLAGLSIDEAASLLEESGVQVEDVPEPAQALWAVVLDRLRRRLQLDLATIRESMKTHGQAAVVLACDILGRPEICGLTGERLALVRDAGVRARYITSLRSAAMAAKAGAPLHELEHLARDAADAAISTGGRVRNCQGDALAHAAYLQSRWDGTTPAPLVTGWPDFDDVVSLVPNLISLGARAGVGKTAFVAGLVRNWTSKGIRVGLVSYEDDARDLGARLMAQRAGVDLRTMAGDVRPNSTAMEMIQDAMAWWSEAAKCLETDDKRPPGRIEDAISSIRNMRRHGCAVAILDNLTCVRMDGGDERFDLVVERALADLRSEAQSLQMPIIVVGHIKRGQSEVDESRHPPRPSDFRNASAWENYSRVVLGMWLDGNGVALRVLKQTKGKSYVDFSVDMAVQAAVVTGLTIRQSNPDTNPRESHRYSR